ncbi:hypothetical protein BJ912DRAFT_922876 [Pholiota molesta]|nr:hypothetical protein BJ912DRAFT_922876 [Pholiota molesta]
MRFFKAFNILHRRTKSATFVSGPPVDHLASTTRPSSASYGQLPASQKNDVFTTSRIFDMVTSRVPSLPPQFNHLADSTTPTFGIRGVRAAGHLWLAFKNLVLEHKAELDAQIIKDLRRILAQDTTLSGKHQLHTGAVLLTRTSVQFRDSTCNFPPKLPTIEEYSNALRLTLATRKELRDQKKAALQALMMRRGLGSRLADLVKSPLSKDSCPEVPSEFMVEPPLSFEVILPATVSTLPPSFSKSSVDSRLPPLASESLKTEINIMFGSRDSSKLLSSLSHKGRGRSGSISTHDITKKSTPRKASSLELHHPDSTAAESFSSGLNTHSERKNEATMIEAGDAVVGDQAIEFDHHEAYDPLFSQDLPSWSSSFMRIPALPSGTSQTFGQELSSVPRLQPSNTTMPNPSMKQAGKECTSRRSFYHYTLMKSGKPNRPIGAVIQSPANQAITKTGSKEKENNQISKTLSAHQKGHSRLPVPSFTRNGG